MKTFGTILLVVLAGNASARANESDDLGPIKVLVCHGPATYEGWGDKANLGAHNVWCYDTRGKRVGRMLHGPFLHEILPDGTHVPLDVVEVTYHHYEDKNRDGVLIDAEIDGTIVTRYEIYNPLGVFQRLAFPVMGHTNQGLAALEVAGAQIPVAEGWFRGTTQLINRGNPVVNTDAGLRIVQQNFSVFSFMQLAASMMP
jgi:hypothetical protein